MNRIAIGVDVGGSHISCMAFDLDKRTFLRDSFSENDLDNHAPANEIIDVWGRTLSKTIRKVGLGRLEGVGFAMPGPFDYVKGIPQFTGENQKYENIYGINISVALRKYLELPIGFPIRFINDATAFAIGEDWMGNAEGFDRSLAITLGTGFGAAFLENGLPVVSGDRVPQMGCLYHLSFEDGTADDYFSTRGLVDRYNRKTGKEVEGGREVAEAAMSEEAAKEVYHDFGSKLADFLEPWMNKFGVQALVIGGNISKAFDLFGPALKDAFQQKGINAEVRISQLKESAAMAGGSRLADSKFWRRVSPFLKEM
ncbi:ROK family protein [Marinilabilia rubra]|uniref:ROK family protein n=1 Tax=Marinilabilia rubra TaxID=2162893 RepID=A0A2U2B464_9BACT|nr:ROK family protein [Marinilabilia rubra]PWD97855.1 ROK family protein [Marinilabilia rubra]